MYARVSAFITEIWFPLSIRRSRAIVTSSHATKSSLRAFRTKADICAVYPGLDEKFSDIQEAQSTYCLNLPSSYILHFSSKIDPRDNTATAIRAFHLSKQMIHHNHKLVIAGKTDPVSQGLVALVEQLGVQDDIIWAGYVPEENLVEIYRRASIYLDPSLYEGFGYQVAEAMVCGTPVVCSNVTSLPELVGDAGITCDPHDDSGIAHAISEVLSSEELQTKMRLAGYKQVTMLSWSNLVTELLSIAENSVCD
jgi:glycosyltransferase involved in cell wall biosynthesis